MRALRERILVVGCGFPQLGLLSHARSLELVVVGLDADPGAAGAGLLDEFVHASTRDVDSIVRAVRAHRVDGLVTCGSEAALYSAAAAAERLGLAFYATPEGLEACRTKLEMRRRYAAGGAPIPRFAGVHTLAEAHDFAAATALPVVIKPARGWGQRGVSVVMHERELEPALLGAFAASAGADADSRPSAVIEEFIEGREYSVNAYSLAGRFEVLAITERIITSYPDPPGITFAEVFPSGLDHEGFGAVGEAAERGARALGIERGPTYTQVRFGARGARLVETAHRLGGGLDPDVTGLATGISLYRRIVGVALGRDDWERSGVESPAHAGAIGRFLVGTPGVVRTVEGLESARRMRGVFGAEVYVRPGDRVHRLTDGSKRIGHVLAAGSDRPEAEHNAERARRVLSIQVEASQ